MPEAFTTNENNCEGLKATVSQSGDRCQWADYCVAPHVVWSLTALEGRPARPVRL